MAVCPAQQSPLCIKHLKTGVPNHIFIFPVDMISYFTFLFGAQDLGFCFSIDFRYAFFDDRDTVTRSLRLFFPVSLGTS